jgi:diaminohydroxyphosphoribosylaminopyrimidine deaminase/5-amino-6-(5-phosphoribosylamino)uracil reductase
MEDTFYFRRCLQLAELGKGFVSPNPLVGAVLVYKEHIIGEGYHQMFGGPHAEVNCLNNVPVDEQHLIEDSVMYVSLEPCNHHGKTPPCTQAILNSGIKQIKIGIKDPNPQVRGLGLKKLEEAGVSVNFCEDPLLFTYQNAPFITCHTIHRPYIILKWAQTKDGYMSKRGERMKISENASDVVVHKWRSEIDAIMIGTETAIVDNPKLTTRLVQGKSPIRVVIDRNGRIDQGSHIYTDEYRTITYSRSLTTRESKKEVVNLDCAEEDELLKIMSDLWAQHHFQSIMIEGGSQLLASFIRQGLWDEARVITSGQIFGEGIKAPFVIGQGVNEVNTGTDKIQFIRNHQLEIRLSAFLKN